MKIFMQCSKSCFNITYIQHWFEIYGVVTWSVMAGTYSVLKIHHRRSTLFFNASSAAAYILHWSEGNCLLKFQLLLSFFFIRSLVQSFLNSCFFFFRASINKINIVDDALRLLINTFAPSTLHMLLIKALDYNCSHCKVRMSST